jgi:hypothetical protein
MPATGSWREQTIQRHEVVLCLTQVAYLLLLDQLKMPTIASLLAHAKQIAKAIRVGNFASFFCGVLELILFWHAALSYQTCRPGDLTTACMCG